METKIPKNELSSQHIQEIKDALNRAEKSGLTNRDPSSNKQLIEAFNYLKSKYDDDKELHILALLQRTAKLIDTRVIDNDALKNTINKYKYK